MRTNVSDALSVPPLLFTAALPAHPATTLSCVHAHSHATAARSRMHASRSVCSASDHPLPRLCRKPGWPSPVSALCSAPLADAAQVRLRHHRVKEWHARHQRVVNETFQLCTAARRAHVRAAPWRTGRSRAGCAVPRPGRAGSGL
jgi:hypothetical protein